MVSIKKQMRTGVHIMFFGCLLGVLALWRWALFGMSTNVATAWACTVPTIVLFGMAVWLSGAERRD